MACCSSALPGAAAAATTAHPHLLTPALWQGRTHVCWCICSELLAAHSLTCGDPEASCTTLAARMCCTSPNRPQTAALLCTPLPSLVCYTPPRSTQATSKPAHKPPHRIWRAPLLRQCHCDFGRLVLCYLYKLICMPAAFVSHLCHRMYACGLLHWEPAQQLYHCCMQVLRRYFTPNLTVCGKVNAGQTRSKM